jgi:hypothetical protein
MSQNPSAAAGIAGLASGAFLPLSNTEKLEAAGGFSFASCSQSWRTILTIAAVSLAAAGCSLTPEREPLPPVAWAEQTPSAAIAMAFAALDAAPAPANTAAVNGPNAQGSCKDLEFSFLNSSCSKKHKKHATIRNHRVATFVIGRPDTTTSSVSSSAEPANVGQSTAHGSDAGGTSQDPKSECAQAWPYYDHTCLLKRAGGSARVVRVIALGRQTRVR